MRTEPLLLCEPLLVSDLSLCEDPPDAVTIYPRDDQNHGVHNSLICHVSGFYPAPVKLYWTKNGRNMSEGGSTSVAHLGADGSFSQTSRLGFSPRRGDVYGCTVEHPALDQPLTRFWGEWPGGTGPDVEAVLTLWCVCRCEGPGAQDRTRPGPGPLPGLWAARPHGRRRLPAPAADGSVPADVRRRQRFQLCDRWYWTVCGRVQARVLLR